MELTLEALTKAYELAQTDAHLARMLSRLEDMNIEVDAAEQAAAKARTTYAEQESRVAGYLAGK